MVAVLRYTEWLYLKEIVGPGSRRLLVFDVKIEGYRPLM
jgi:hypothetical protein